MNEQIGVMVVQERRWTRQRFDQRVVERKAEGKIRGGTEEGREAAFVHLAATDMADDYEMGLAELRDEATTLREIAVSHMKELIKKDTLIGDLAEKLETANIEITVLTLCRDGLEGQNDKLRAMVQCSDDALRAENVELWDALKAINKELYELRIKTGLGQKG